MSTHRNKIAVGYFLKVMDLANLRHLYSYTVCWLPFFLVETVHSSLVALTGTVLGKSV